MDITCATARKLIIDTIHNSINTVDQELHELEKRELMGGDWKPQDQIRLEKLVTYRAAMLHVVEYYKSRN